jgi:hypothetical protein
VVNTILDATARSDAWFEVVIPENLGGRGERGLIAASQVTPVGGIATLPCRALRGNPCSKPTAGASASAAPASGARSSNAGGAQASNTRAATQSKRSGSTFAPGLFVQFGGGATHTPTPSEFGTHGSEGGLVIAGVAGGVNRVMVSFNALEMVPCPATINPRLREIPDRGVTIGLERQNEEALANATCDGVYASYAYSADVVGLIPHTPVLVGGGFRVEEKEATWFGSAGLGWIRNNGRAFIAVRGNFGKDYASGLVTVAIRLWGKP